jgi:tetratricopeptide (TPR) repeat protein
MWKINQIKEVSFMKTCPACKNPLKDEVKFCTKCGTKIDILSSAIPPELVARIDILEKKISQDPLNAQNYISLGELFLDLTFYDKALLQFQKAVNVDNANIDAFVKSGDVYLHMKKFDHAKLSYENALKLNKDLLVAQIGLFLALKGLGKLDDAIVLGVGIIRRDPNMLSCRKALKDIYLQRNEEDKAIKEIAIIVSHDPLDVGSYKQMAQIYEKRKDLEMAFDAYKKVLNLDSDDKEALLFVGTVQYQQANYDESIKCLKAYLVHDPDNVTARILLSLGYIKKGALDQAVTILSKLSPETITVTEEHKISLGQAYLAIGEYAISVNKLDDAKSYLKYSLKFFKTEAAEKTLARVYAAEGDKMFARKSYMEAKDLFQQARDLDSNNKSYQEKLKQVEKHLKTRHQIKIAAAVLVGIIILVVVASGIRYYYSTGNIVIHYDAGEVVSISVDGSTYQGESKRIAKGEHTILVKGKLGFKDYDTKVTIIGGDKKELKIALQPFAAEIGRDGRFIAFSNETVLDTRTNLMWAARDNGSDTNWANAKSYCENYRGGVYTDWRIPTQDELAGLYDNAKTHRSCGYNIHLTELINLSCPYVWASETRGSDNAAFNFGKGERSWNPQSNFYYDVRAIPVRSGKIGESNIVNQNKYDKEKQSSGTFVKETSSVVRKQKRAVKFNCKGPGTMDVGQIVRCELPEENVVTKIGISVGCNDGEFGSFTVTFDDGSRQRMKARCNSTMKITPTKTKSMTLRMDSGGGGDKHISFTCCGSKGWSVVYYK